LAIILADYADLGRIFLNPFIIEQSREYTDRLLSR
jgi:hypothetical protein